MHEVTTVDPVLAGRLAQAMRDANTPDVWIRGAVVPFGHFAEVALRFLDLRGRERAARVEELLQLVALYQMNAAQAPEDERPMWRRLSEIVDSRARRVETGQLSTVESGDSPQPALDESGRLDVTAAELADLLTEARAAIERMHLAALRAVAHDRQPYPTADAYEKACAALRHHRQRADEAEARGFARAVAMLRDDARFDHWWAVLPADDPANAYWERRGRNHLADYLEVVADEGLTDRARHDDGSNPPNESMLWYVEHTHPGLRYSHQHFPANETPGHNHAGVELVPWARRDAPQETEGAP